MKHAVDFDPVMQTTANGLASLVTLIHLYPLQVIAWCAVLLVARSFVYRSRS